MLTNQPTSTQYDAIIIGAGAAGLMCAIRAGERGLSVLVIEKSDYPAKKIRISGGGRCNFTNLDISPDAYLSPNPHFCKSALSRYTQWHFIELLSQHGLTYHEKTLGQLFCEQKSTAIIELLLTNAQQHNVTIIGNQTIQSVVFNHNMYRVACKQGVYSSPQVVIACGGPSIPKIGASDFALRLAKQFQLKNTPFVPALVPLTLPESLLAQCKPLAGVSVWVDIACHGMHFRENLLFTHRGLSGPAVLQISSYWKKGDTLTIDWLPNLDVYTTLLCAKNTHPQQQLSTLLATHLPKKLAEMLVMWRFENRPLQQYSEKALKAIAEQLQQWTVSPNGTEGMKKAEVSTGGIHPDALSSKTFECKTQKGLYAIGEAIDVTGWLGGYNFQWAWSSGWCCGDSLNRSEAT